MSIVFSAERDVDEGAGAISGLTDFLLVSEALAGLTCGVGLLDNNIFSILGASAVFTGDLAANEEDILMILLAVVLAVMTSLSVFALTRAALASISANAFLGAGGLAVLLTPAVGLSLSLAAFKAALSVFFSFTAGVVTNLIGTFTDVIDFFVLAVKTCLLLKPPLSAPRIALLTRMAIGLPVNCVRRAIVAACSSPAVHPT